MGKTTERKLEHKDHLNEYPLVNDLATLELAAQIAALEIQCRSGAGRPKWRTAQPGSACHRPRPDPVPASRGAEGCQDSSAAFLRGRGKGMGLDPLR